MAWKQIGGRRYYYRSERRGRKVASVYVGAGARGAAGAAAVAEAQAQRLQRAHERQAERAALATLEQVAAYFDQVQLLLDAALVLGGYHRHKRQWRKRRGYRSQDA
jgi:hypothetical protein